MPKVSMPKVSKRSTDGRQVSSKPKKSAKPPKFVMWKSTNLRSDSNWQRQWFGNELDPKAVFNVRGIGIREPMFNANVYRPIGTGDWLIMLFHDAARLDRDNPLARSPPNSLILWPPGAPQFYSWGKIANSEPHSWMHVEGSWVALQVKENRLPVAKPVVVADSSTTNQCLQNLMDEMRQNEVPDSTILQNVFQNWARSIARYLRNCDEQSAIPRPLLNVREYLDMHFTESPKLSELAKIACMSRSYLCHQFHQHFGSSISSYIVRRRMSTAQRLVYDLSLRPGEIAKAVGYPDIFQFSKQFKKTFGFSPMNYRKQKNLFTSQRKRSR